MKPDTTTTEGQLEASEMFLLPYRRESLLIAKLVGWNVEERGNDLHVSGEGFAITLHSPKYLYNYKWMFLAWRVLNWAANTRFYADQTVDGSVRVDRNRAVLNSQDLPPAEAQRAWLDTILELAIEAGMVGNE